MSLLAASPPSDGTPLAMRDIIFVSFSVPITLPPATLATQIVSQSALYPQRPQIPLTKVLIGTGLISPSERICGYYETLCTTKPDVEKPVLNETRYDMMAAAMPRGMDVVHVCYNISIP